MGMRMRGAWDLAQAGCSAKHPLKVSAGRSACRTPGVSLDFTVPEGHPEQVALPCGRLLVSSAEAASRLLELAFWVPQDGGWVGKAVLTENGVGVFYIKFKDSDGHQQEWVPMFFPMGRNGGPGGEQLAPTAP